jgi:hypothetical protein
MKMVRYEALAKEASTDRQTCKGAIQFAAFRLNTADRSPNFSFLRLASTQRLQKVSYPTNDANNESELA